MTEIIQAGSGADIVTWTPHFVQSVDDAVALVRQREEYLTKVLRKGIDYGVIPGTKKPSLYKPGAERILSAMGLSVEFENDGDPVLDLIGQPEHGNEPLVFYQRRCRVSKQLTPTERMVVASASGSCSSRESKYRYRFAERACPECGKTGFLRKSKQPGSEGNFYCWSKPDKGMEGCGKQFDAKESKEIARQEVGKVPNPDIADIANAVLKMADKRALVAAAIIATGYSDYLTQDVEDHVGGEEATDDTEPPPEGEVAPPRRQQRQAASKPPGRVIDSQAKPAETPATATSAPQAAASAPAAKAAPGPASASPAAQNEHHQEIRRLLDKGLTEGTMSQQDLAKILLEVGVRQEEIKKSPRGWLEALDEERASTMHSLVASLAEPESIGDLPLPV
jgi:hypothetical protein